MTHADPTRNAPRPISGWDEMIAPLRPLQTLSTETKIALMVLALLAVWGMAILAFGVPALVWPMKLVVPGIIATLVAITWSM